MLLHSHKAIKKLILYETVICIVLFTRPLTTAQKAYNKPYAAFVTMPSPKPIIRMPKEIFAKARHNENRKPLSTTTNPPFEEETTTQRERLPLLDSRIRSGPQVIFLADDPDAAAKIPSLLTTLYDLDVSSGVTRVKPGFTSGTTATKGITESLKYPTTLSELHLTTPSPEPERDRDYFQGDNALGSEISERYLKHNKLYFPPRPRPSSNNDDVINRRFGGGSFHLSGDLGGRHPSLQGLFNMTRVTHIEAECQNDYMLIHVRFNGSFEGLIYSLGYSHDLDCVYVNGSGRDVYQFGIKLNQCGTLSSNDNSDLSPSLNKNVMWNTLTVQYNPLIEEEWDEHFKVTCEYGLEIWKTVTFPFLDVEVQTGNPMVFSLEPPECHMEIRHGFSSTGPRVTGPVRVGDPLTLVIYMRSQYDEFDIVVSDCFAHNGGSKKIMLIDSYGCPVDEKLISHFEGRRIRDSVYETQIYAFFKTFRFTGSPALYMECGVRMCQGDCPPLLCKWRGRSAKTKRSAIERGDHKPSIISQSSNGTESLHLFQALQVIKDEEVTPFSSSNSQGPVHGEDVCIRMTHISIIAGILAGISTLVVASFVVLCSRLKRLKKSSECPMPPQRISKYKSEYVPPTKRRLE